MAKNRKKRSLKPRTRESVTDRQLDVDADGGGQGLMRGDYSINPGVKGVRLERPRVYENGGKTVFRVWNMLDPEDPGGALLNGRLSAFDLAGLGGMSISEPAMCVQMAGISKETSNGKLLGNSEEEKFSYVIARSKSSTYDGVGFWDLPYPKLFVTAKKAMEAGEFGHGGAWNPKWNALRAGKFYDLPGFKQNFYLVCSLLENGQGLNLVRERKEYKRDGKEVVDEIQREGIPLGDKPDDPLMVLQLSVSAGQNLLKMACVEKENYSGDPDVDPSCLFKYGDPCGKFDAASQKVKGGLFFTIYNPDKVEIKKHTSYTGPSSSPIVPYECAVNNKHLGPNGVISASLTAAQVDNIFNKHLFLWKDSDEDPEDSFILHEPTIEQRCELIAKGFRQVPQLVEFCWMSHPEYLEFDSVQAILKDRTTVSVTTKPDLDDEDDDEGDDEGDVFADEPAAKPKKKGKPKTAAELVDEFDDSDDEVDEDELDGDDDPEDELELDEEGDESDDFEEEEFEDDEGEEDDALGEIVDEVEDEFADDDDSSGEEDEAEEEGESNDFDEFDDEAEVDAVVNEKLNQSLAKAKGIARSRKRTSKKSTEKPSTKAAPKAATKGTKKASKKTSKKPATKGKKSSTKK